MKRVWERLWFPADTALNIAAARVIFALHAIWILLSRDLPAASAFPAEFWAMTPMSWKWRYLVFPGHAGIERAIQAVTIAVLIFVVLGVRPRLSAFVGALLLYHLAPLESLFWTNSPFERGLTTDLLALLTLSAAPCGDALTFSPRRGAHEPADYGWALRLSQFHLATIYLLAGTSKFRRSGIDWINPTNTRRWLLVANQEDHARVFKSIGPWIADHPALCWAMAFGAVAVDLGFVLAVFWKRSRIVVVPMAFAGHMAILFALNIFFINIPQLLVFINWSWLKQRFGRNAVPP